MATPEGTISFWINHDHSDWATNDSGYNFGPFDTKQDLALRAIKHPDKTLEINVIGPLGAEHTLRGPMPVPGDKGIHVAVTWQGNELKLYLNGELTHTGTIPDGK